MHGATVKIIELVAQIYALLLFLFC